MKIRLSLLTLVTSIVFLASTSCRAEAIHYHGKLQSPAGEAASGLHRITFTVYADSSLSGSPLWSETRTVAVDREGNYEVELAEKAAESPMRGHRSAYVVAEARGEATSAVATAATVITTIPQGIWLNCNPDNTSAGCDDGATINSESALQTIAAGHFRYVLNADNFWGTQAQITAYANQANTSGLKIIWYLGSDFSVKLSSTSFSLISQDTELATSFCSGCSNTAFVTALINYLKAFPATAGYLIDDEEIQAAANGYPIGSSGKKKATTYGNAIASLASVIRAADSTHAIYGTEDYVDLTSASQAELAAYFGYIANGTLNYYGTDYYPVGALASTPTNAQLTADQKADGNWLDAVATSKSATGTFEDLQAYNWSDSWEGGCPSSSCAFPTVAQMQDMLTGATTSTTAPAQIFWWEYTDVVYNNQWSNLLTAANPQ